MSTTSRFSDAAGRLHSAPQAVFLPIYRALRLSDGKKGASLGKVYRLMLVIDQELSKPIDGITEIEREGYHALFSARVTIESGCGLILRVKSFIRRHNNYIPNH